MSPLIKLTFVVLFAFGVGVDAGKTTNSRQLSTLSNAINDFSFGLFKETAEKYTGKDILISPLSAHIVLALLSLGAEGKTQTELNSALHLPNAEFTKSAFATMFDTLNSKRDIKLNLANNIFVKNGTQFVISHEFKTLANDVFESDVEHLDFTRSTRAARTINSWVEGKTNKKMKNLISSSNLGSNIKIILFNALYFKIVELPYKNGDLSMVIVLPNKVTGLKTVVSKIGSGESLTSAFENMRRKLIKIHLPRFKIESNINLVDLLQKVGIKKIFRSGAELGGLLPIDETLFVSKAIQRAIIEIGEEGTDSVFTEVGAHSATEYINPEVPTQIYVDHPFLFCIKTSENIPIFIGQYTGVKI